MPQQEKNNGAVSPKYLEDWGQDEESCWRGYLMTLHHWLLAKIKSKEIQIKGTDSEPLTMFELGHNVYKMVKRV